MKRFLFGLLLALAAIAQSTIVPQLNPLEVSPNFVLVLLFIWAGLRGTREGLVWAFLAGLLIDVLSVETLGVNGIALASVALLAGSAQSRMFRSSVFFSIVLVVAATFIYSLIIYTIRDVRPNVFILVQALLHALIVPFAYIIIRTFDR
ncbi:MAG: rod shape-determining protein MreD [Thermomicrobiales bacterium]